MNSDFKDLLSSLNRHKVKYLIIGGYAVMRYTEPRYTKDLDIWLEADITNSKKVYKVLEEFGAPVDNLKNTDFSKPGILFVMGVAPVRVDVITRVKGAQFKTAWKNREISTLYDIKVPFISKKDLIKTKKAAGRPQDLLDLEKLRR